MRLAFPIILRALCWIVVLNPSVGRGGVIGGVGVGWDVHAPGNQKTQNEAMREHLRL
jgi:hypothetical protein